MNGKEKTVHQKKGASRFLYIIVRSPGDTISQGWRICNRYHDIA